MHNNSRLKIGMVIPSLVVRGGAEKIFIWLAQELTKRGHKVIIFTSRCQDQYFLNTSDLGVGIRILGGKGYKGRFIEWIVQGLRIRKEMTTLDVVVAYNFPSYLWVLFSRLFSFSKHFPLFAWYCTEPLRQLYPEICFKHSMNLDTGILDKRFKKNWKNMAARFLFDSIVLKSVRFLDKTAVGSMDKIIAISDFIGGQIQQIFFTGQIESCHPGIKLEELVLRDGSSESSYGDYIFCASRLEPFKNLQSVIRAVKTLVDQGAFRFSKFIISGDGPYRAELDKLIKELHLEGIVELKGFVSSQDLLLLYSRCSLVVYLPLDESFGLVFLEAGMFKKAVIGPDEGAPKEIIINGRTGYLVNAQDPESISKVIEKLQNNPQEAREMGLHGYQRLLENFAIEKYADRFMDIITKTLRNKRFS